MHAEDYLIWEASLENYFEWKPMVEEREVLFINFFFFLIGNATKIY